MTQPNSGVFSEGDLLFTHTSSSWRTTAGTFGMTTGKWYWEAYQYEDLGGNGFPCGIYDMDSGRFLKNQAGDYPGQSSSTYGANYVCYTNSGTNATKRHNGSESNLSYGAGASGDVWQVAFDADNGKIWFGQNNTWDNSGNPATGTGESYSSIPSSTWVPITCSYNDGNSENYPQNFGQDGSFSGRITDAGNADGNGFGTFKYSPPSGFLSLCAANIPVDEDIDPALTDTNIHSKNFNVGLYAGNSSTQTVDVGLQPDLVIWKNRSTANSIIQMDSSRGTSASMQINKDGTESNAYAGYMTAFSSTGPTFASTGGADVGTNQTGSNYVTWCWRANGGTTSTNTDGTIASSVQANTAGGFSIVTYSGNSTSGATIGHGLSAKPDCIWIKARNKSESWVVYHTSTTANNYTLLNHNYTPSDSTSRFNDTEPSSTVITLGNDPSVNGSTYNYVAYVWHNVIGAQKFGTYYGNGNADGPFINMGFRPRMVIFKRTDSTDNWQAHDTARDIYNPSDTEIAYDSDNSQTETSSTNNLVDFCANGIKIRNSNNAYNNSTGTYIYLAWGDVPYKYPNVHNQYSS